MHLIWSCVCLSCDNWYTASPGDCMLWGVLRMAPRAESPCELAMYTPQLGGPIYRCCMCCYMLYICCICIYAYVVCPHVLLWGPHCHFLYTLCNFWAVSGPCSGILETQRVCPRLPIPALHSTQWLLFAFGAGEQPLAWEEQSLGPVPANTNHAFLSLCDRLFCQQQEVMLPLSSPRGNSSWFPWGCMQL